MTPSIILHIDSFDENKTVLSYGVAMAQKLKARLVLFDVQFTAKELELVDQRGWPTKSRAHLRATNYLKEQCEKIRRIWSNTTYHLIEDILYGKIRSKTKYLIEAIKKEGPVLSVMGVPKDLDTFTSTGDFSAVAIAQASSAPLLLIPDNLPRYRRLKHIGYFLEGKRQLESASKEIEYCARLAETFDAQLHICFFSKSAPNVANLELALADTYIQNEIAFPKTEIIDYSPFNREERVEALLKYPIHQLIGLSSKAKEQDQKLLVGQQIKALLEEAETPVLLF